MLEIALVLETAVLTAGFAFFHYRHQKLIEEMAKMLASRSFGEYVAGENSRARAKAMEKQAPKSGPEDAF